jgi:hypothetical protein
MDEKIFYKGKCVDQNYWNPEWTKSIDRMHSLTDEEIFMLPDPPQSEIDQIVSTAKRKLVKSRHPKTQVKTLKRQFTESQPSLVTV